MQEIFHSKWYYFKVIKPSNCDFNFFVFRQSFHIISLKFLKFEIVKNVAKNFLILWKNEKFCKVNKLI
jgi:hypothetical protein